MFIIGIDSASQPPTCFVGPASLVFLPFILWSLTVSVICIHTAISHAHCYQYLPRSILILAHETKTNVRWTELGSQFEPVQNRFSVLHEVQNRELDPLADLRTRTRQNQNLRSGSEVQGSNRGSGLNFGSPTFQAFQPLFSLPTSLNKFTNLGSHNCKSLWQPMLELWVANMSNHLQVVTDHRAHLNSSRPKAIPLPNAVDGIF